MKLKVVTAAIALVGALALPTVQADAQTNPQKRRTVVYNNRDNTVQISRDEDGRTRTRVIIQKRSFLDPGTETFPGERVGNTGYVQTMTQTAGSPIDNTSAGICKRQSPLRGPFTLPRKNSH